MLLNSKKMRIGHLGTSRSIATYDWEYSSQSKPVEKYKDSYKHRYKDEYKNYWCVEIDGWLCPWNRELSRDRKTLNFLGLNNHKLLIEVGSTFTVQGFDLNYAGVIIGPSVKYRDGKIKFDISASKNKGAVQNRKLENGEMKNFGEDLLKMN